MRKAICYDVGMRASATWPSRPDFDPPTVKREMEIIKRDLGCEAVRIFGEDPERLRIAAEHALSVGLRVWLSPELFNARPRRWLPYLATCARMARELDSPDVVFVVGRELTFFMRGLVLGKDVFARMNTFLSMRRLMANLACKGSWHRNLNRFLARAAATVRAHFPGPVTYAAGTWEKVDWSIFDMVAVDLYRDTSNEDKFRETLRSYFGAGKPVAISEFGCCTYRGAADKGGLGWAVVDRAATPPAIKGDLTRDEDEQAGYLTELLDVFAGEGVDTAFVFALASYSYPRRPDPRHDLDLAAYGLVSYYGDRPGTSYPELNWEPKKAFYAVAGWHAGDAP